MHSWLNLLLLYTIGLVSALLFVYAANPATFALLSNIPILKDDPFVHIVFGVFKDPEEYFYWQYLLTTSVMAPLGYTAICFSISVLSGEFFLQRAHAIKQMKGAAYHLFISAPVMSFWFQKFIRGHWGKIYLDLGGDSGQYSLFYEAVVTPLCYWIITDASFYWQHRVFHSQWLYMQYHAFHHKCRPITTFCGNSAGLVELHVVEFCHALMPPLFMPIHIKTWILLALGNQAWTIYLHTFDDCGISRLPGWLYDCRDHHVHHYYGIKNYNFGLFFQLWDRTMGTYLDRDAVDREAVALSRAGLKPVDETAVLAKQDNTNKPKAA